MSVVPKQIMDYRRAVQIKDKKNANELAIKSAIKTKTDSAKASYNTALDSGQMGLIKSIKKSPIDKALSKAKK